MTGFTAKEIALDKNSVQILRAFEEFKKNEISNKLPIIADDFGRVDRLLSPGAVLSKSQPNRIVVFSYSKMIAESDV